MLWAKVYNLPVTLEDFSQYYSLKSAPGQHGYYYARADDDLSRVVTRLPSSQKNWKDYFFWIEGNVFYERCPINASFSELGVTLVQFSFLISRIRFLIWFPYIFYVWSQVLFRNIPRTSDHFILRFLTSRRLIGQLLCCRTRTCDGNFLN